ncbi:hypothetical protein [Pseudomonas silesiensis]|uniref:hypothetical protein n=1 Tax=Pseudomonas silesiensis TaxID=1853130 RepID=UPI0030D776D5
MASNFNRGFGDHNLDLTGLFNATARAFERDAQRISRQLLPATPGAGRKRANSR